MKYELSFIVSGALPETEHLALQKEILSYLEKASAKVSGNFEIVGRRKLAYPIAKQKHGFYMYLVFDLEDRTALRELDTQLKHNSHVLRHLIVKLEGAALRPKVQRLRPLTAKVKKTEPSPVGAPPAVSRPTPKADLDLDNLADIDKRLDEILAKEPET